MKHFYTITLHDYCCGVQIRKSQRFLFLNRSLLTEDGTQIDAPDFNAYTQNGATGGFYAYGISGSDSDYAWTTEYNSNAVTGADLVAYAYLRAILTVTEGVSDGFLVNHSTYGGGPQKFPFYCD